ncbi:MAG: hypothetical protein SFV23_00460, partial [Planctomycetaceae bacterium]|nr:hypothetical protein [Planctomycetaceae bacterium]
QLWKTQPVLQRRQFFQGRQIRGEAVHDVLWLTPHGRPMNDKDWHAGYVRCLGMRLEGQMDDEIDEFGRRITGDTLLVLMNSHHEPIPFRLPEHAVEQHWQPVIDTAQRPLFTRLKAGDLYPLQGRSLAVLRLAVSWKGHVLRWLPSWLIDPSGRNPTGEGSLPQQSLAAMSGS